MYLRTQLVKAVPEVKEIAVGNDRDFWLQIQTKATDPEWRTERIKKDEKFDMHLKALVSTFRHQDAKNIIIS